LGLGAAATKLVQKAFGDGIKNKRPIREKGIKLCGKRG
jgi:hypothetical protein